MEEGDGDVGGGAAEEEGEVEAEDVELCQTMYLHSIPLPK